MDALQRRGHRQAVRPGHADDRPRRLHQQLVRRARSEHRRQASGDVPAPRAERRGPRARGDAAARAAAPTRSRKQHKQGKLTARERIALLCDPGSRFLEIGLLVAYDQYDGQAPGAGVVTGIGIVHGREVVVVANDATVKAGSWWPETIKKILRAQEIAMRCRVPIIYLVDSAGVNLPYQGGVFPGPVRRGAHLLLQLDHAPLSAGSADRGGDGAVHRRRRVSAGAVRRDPDGEGHVVHGTRRPEPREGRDGPDDRRRDARRRGDAHRDQRRRALRGRRRRRVPREDPRARRAAAARSRPRMPERRRSRATAPSAAVPTRGSRRRSTTFCPPTIACRTTCTTSSRAIVDDGKLDEFQGEPRAGDDLRRRARSRASRSASSRTSADSSRAGPARSRASAASSTPRARRRSRTSSTAATGRASRCCSCRMSRASWSAPKPSTKGSSAPARASSKRWRPRACRRSC